MWIDLFVDAERPRRTSASLFEQIRDAIANGRLAPGDRLPTSRELAVELGVARSTVAAVYGRLVGEGFLEARTGDGTFVAALAALAPTAPARRAGGARAARSRRRRRSLPSAARPDRPPNRPARPVAVPARRLATVRHRRAAHAAAGYGDHAGLPALRRAVAAWVSRSRGVHAAPEQVLVTAGAQQAFDLFARVLLAPGDTVAVEDPGYPVARRAFEAHGAAGGAGARRRRRHRGRRDPDVGAAPCT